MLYEIARALVQRIFRDKILMGLVIIGILAIFMSGISTKEEPAPVTKATSAPSAAQTTPVQTAVEPKLAADFLKWWLGGAFDYAPATAVQSHQQAFAWMTAQTQAAFQAAFWTPDVASGITNGQIVAAFHPTSIEAEAVNPDGSVVIAVAGTLVIQSGGQPVTQQLLADFLVQRQRDGLRVAGIYNKLAPSTSVY